jgi:hypothetical protein
MCGICLGQNGRQTGTEYFVFPCKFHFTGAPFSCFIYLPVAVCNNNSWQHLLFWPFLKLESCSCQCLLALVDCSSVTYDAVSYPRRIDPHCCQNLKFYIVHLCVEFTLLYIWRFKNLEWRTQWHMVVPQLIGYIIHCSCENLRMFHYEASGWSDLPTACLIVVRITKLLMLGHLLDSFSISVIFIVIIPS